MLSPPHLWHVDICPVKDIELIHVLNLGQSISRNRKRVTGGISLTK